MKMWHMALLAAGVGAGVGLIYLATRAIELTVAAILSNPERYRDRHVTLEGTIIKPDDYPAIDDGTGVLILNPSTIEISDQLAGLLGLRAKCWGPIKIANGTPYLYVLGLAALLG